MICILRYPTTNFRQDLYTLRETKKERYIRIIHITRRDTERGYCTTLHKTKQYVEENLSEIIYEILAGGRELPQMAHNTDVPVPNRCPTTTYEDSQPLNYPSATKQTFCIQIN